MSYDEKKLKELTEKMGSFERKYKQPYEEFPQNIPDGVVGHDDWIEWTYSIKAAAKLSNKIHKLSFLSGK